MSTQDYYLNVNCMENQEKDLKLEMLLFFDENRSVIFLYKPIDIPIVL